MLNNHCKYLIIYRFIYINHIIGQIIQFSLCNQGILYLLPLFFGISNYLHSYILQLIHIILYQHWSLYSMKLFSQLLLLLFSVLNSLILWPLLSIIIFSPSSLPYHQFHPPSTHYCLPSSGSYDYSQNLSGIH